MEGRCKLLHDRVAVRTAFETTPRRDPRAAPRVPVALAPCATTIRVYRARPRPRAWPECRERVRRPAPRHPLWGRSAPPQRVGPHPSNKTSQLLMLRQSERQRRPPRGWRRGSRSGPRVRAAANALARNRMRRGASAFRNCALLPLGDGRVYVRPPRNLVKRRGDRVLQPAANDPRESGCTRILASDFFLPNPGGADPGGTQENTQF